MDVDASRWFPGHLALPAAEVRLFCLPYAGGGASAYRPWTQRLAPEVDTVPVQLPGRETRRHEPAIERAEALIDQLAEPLLAHADRPYALFGHSLGGLLAFELAHALTGCGHPPIHLFVSGWEPPHLPRPAGRVDAHTLPDEQLVEHVLRLAGMPPQMRWLADLLRATMPALRADLTAGETYRWRQRPALTLPMTALAGRDDPLVEPGRFAAWSELGGCGVRIRLLPGGHFYLHQRVDPLLAIIRSTLVSGGFTGVTAGGIMQSCVDGGEDHSAADS